MEEDKIREEELKKELPDNCTNIEVLGIREIPLEEFIFSEEKHNKLFEKLEQAFQKYTNDEKNKQIDDIQKLLEITGFAQND